MAIAHIDPLASFRAVSINVDAAVRRGELHREKAREVIEKARKSYSSNEYNRTADKVNAGWRGDKRK